VVEPDLVFVLKKHLSIIREKNIHGVPDLTIEVLSPTTKGNDPRLKLSLYERFGVPEYWIVDPETNTIQMFPLACGHYPAPLELHKIDVLSTPFLPGLSIPLSEVFTS